MSTGSNNPIIKIGVTELVQFSARQGDLFREEPQGPDAQQGLRGHQQLQKSRRPPWQAEKALSAIIPIEDDQIQISGRVDLFNDAESPVIIEEIKTCYGSGHLLPEERKARHWAQLKVYAALYFFQHNKQQELRLRISYYDLMSRQIFQEEEVIDTQEAVAYCKTLIQTYWHWWTLIQNQKQQARYFAQQLAFPYQQFRPGQRELAKAVYRHIRDGKDLVFEAPTGSGKTLSVLFPAIKIFGEGQVQQLVYLTPKGSAQHNALQALTQLNANSHMDCLLLTAKEKACPCLSQKETCHTETGLCSRTIGFYDRLPAAREAALMNKWCDQEQLQQLAREFHLCPFALAMHLAPWFSIVIADVNYFFDPLVRLSCFDNLGDQRVLLVDELHNLPGRGRDMYSAELNSAQAAAVLSQLPKPFLFFKKALNRLIIELRNLEPPSIHNNEHPALPQNLYYLLNDMLKALQQTHDNGFAGGLLGQESHLLRQWVKDLYRFIAISQLLSDAHRLSLEKHQDESRLKILCLDASLFLGRLFSKARSTIGFSATLQPFDFSLQQLGLKAETTTRQLPSWFPAHHQLNLCCRFISTQWQQREQSLSNLVALIHLFFSAKTGHYLVFFPSYAYLQMALTCFRQQFPAQDILVQSTDTDDDARREFIHMFTREKKPLLGFAILGGIFAEGVDYAGDALIGVMIVGTGMPQPGTEQKLIADYYKKQGKNAYQYTYQFPGFIRLMQTAGRLIRSELDRGAVIFVEPRLQRRDYQTLFPKHLQLQFCDSLTDVETRLHDFWHTN